MNSGRLAGILLLIGAVALCLLGGLWLATSRAGGGLQASGAVLGAGLLLILVLLPGGAGAYLLARSRSEVKQEAERNGQRRILDIVKSRGQVPVSDLALELGASRDDVQRQIHALVGMGLFSGYVNWEEGVLYSAQASGLRELERCKHCGGELKLVGKGVIACPYCGTEYFLP
jgi:hypothetical protein